MKLTILVLGAFISLSSPLNLDGSFDTPLDHYRNQNGRTARFHYQVNIDYYQENGPLFFFINEAGYFTTEWIESGLIYDLALELGAALFTTSFRYFRDNLPTETASLEDLEQLTVEQAIGDIAVFINTAKRHLANDQGKVYVWGTDLGGTLAILARQKLPNLISGAWSSNGVFLPQVFTTSVYLTIADNIREVGSDACGDSVTEAFREIEGLIARQEDATNSGITSFCNAMSVIPSDPMRSLSRWIRFTYNTDVGSCSNYDYAGMIQWTSDTQWHNPGTSTGNRQFLYLQCTQFGNLRVTTSTGMFGRRVTEEFRQRICEDSFGEDYDFDQLYLSVEYFNIAHGGQYPKVSNVIYTNGYINQWISHGITHSYDLESYVVNVPGYSRWADLTSLNRLDSVVLYNAKNTVRDNIKRWHYNATIN